MSAEYHLVEKDNCKNNILVDSAVLVEDGVVWDQGEIQMSLNYASNDISLIENNNESYLSAADGNDTQYFSVNETALGDLNDITLYTNGADVEISDQQDINTLDGEHNIYAVGSSDDLYSFQIAYDDDGNIQRYRYVLRLNDNGLLESVSEPVELLPVEQEIELPENEVADSEQSELPAEVTKLQPNEGVVKKEEYEEVFDEELDDSSNNNEDPYEELHVNEDEDEFFDDTEEYQENETKSGVLSRLAVEKIKGNTYQSQESHSQFESDNFIATNNESATEETVIESVDNNSQIQSIDASLEDFQQVYGLDSETETNVEEEADEEELIVASPPTIEEGEELCKSPDSILDSEHFKDNENVEFIEELNENESDTEEFEIVDGIHVTADTDSNEDELPDNLNRYIEDNIQGSIKLQENVLQNADPKLKRSNNKVSNKINKNLMYYVIKHPEKENVGTFTQQLTNNKVVRTNPRSVLKSSFAFFEQRKEKEKPETTPVKNDKKPKNRENSQARILHNYIAKTTILHAPVRQERLPRKQTIKPVTRADEEIIVQEVVVSSNGIVETTEDGVVKSKTPLVPTDYVQVIDSEEEYDSKSERKRKKKRKKRKAKVPEIVISDSEDGSSDIVEIDISSETDHAKEDERSTEDSATSKTLLEKRKRGRPRKRLNASLSEGGRNTPSSLKKLKSSNESESTDLSPLKSELRSIRTKWKCDSCSKEFSSRGSLKTHLQNANHESSSKEDSFKKPLKPMHKCLTCYETFKNNYLLIKHTKEHKETIKFECGVCKKLFSDRLQLNNHKRSHVKEQMVISTTLPKHSPKRKSLIVASVPRSESKFKCICCTKIFSSQILLNAHLRTHKRFTCSTCTKNFVSKLALEDHVQNSCVKKVPFRRPLFKTASAIKKTPIRTASRLSLRNITPSKTSDEAGSSSPSSVKNKKKNNSVDINLRCDNCTMVFKSYTSLFHHKVRTHGLETPDKNLSRNVNKNESVRHTSVPASSRLRTAFANFKTLQK